MNRPLPRITCNKCNKSQTWNNQVNCTSCGERLNNWSVASQLRVARDNEQVRLWENEMADWGGDSGNEA